MEQRLEIAQEFIDGGHPKELVMHILSIPGSSYYYTGKKDPKPKGRRVSTKTYKTDGSWVDNVQVFKNIEEILGEEFVRRCWCFLQQHFNSGRHVIIRYSDLLVKTPTKADM